MFGFLNIHKPLGLTSHDVVHRLRKKLGLKRIGHAGTLDPLAQGVLPIALGNCTRLLEFLPGDKRYRATIKLGEVTATWDAEQTPTPVASARQLSLDTIESALMAFEGITEQLIPPHSAVHVNGKKLYEYARQGIEVPLPKRQTTFYELNLISSQDIGTDTPSITVDIHCASGTYVRSLAWQLGESLKVGGYLTSLTRTQHGHFTLETSIPLDAFLEAETPETHILDPTPFIDLPAWSLTRPELAKKLSQGQKLGEDDIDDAIFVKKIRNNALYLVVYEQKPFAIVRGESHGRLKPIKVLMNL